MEINFKGKNSRNVIEKKNNEGINFQNDEYMENEEEEINSDEYISSSMLDVDTNTYINQTTINKSIKENELEIKKNEKEDEKEIEKEVLTNKMNNKEKNNNENNEIKDILKYQNKMNFIQPFFDTANQTKNIEKNNNKNIFIKDNIENFSYNSNFNNNINNNKKASLNNEIRIKFKRINLNDLKKKNNINNLIKKSNKENNSIKLNKLIKTKENTNNNKIIEFKHKEEDLNSCLLNENLLKDFLNVKKGKNYKALKNSQSIKIGRAQGRISASPKFEIFAKNINLDILRKLKKNYSNNIMDNYNHISQIYIKKFVKKLNSRDYNSPFKCLKINTSISANNKKVDFLLNSKLNEEMIDDLKNKKNNNYKESLDIFKSDKSKISKDKNKSKNKSKNKGKEKKNIIKLKNEIKDEKNKKLLILSKINKFKYFNSLLPKNNENKINKNIANEQFTNYSSTMKVKNKNNMTNNNSELFNKSIDSKKMYEFYKIGIKERRNLSTDIDNMPNNILYRFNKNKNELKEHYLFNIMKKKEAFSNRSQNKGFCNIKNNSKFNLRNNLLFNFSKKIKINDTVNDNSYNYIVITKTNKSIDKSNYKSKNDIKSTFENHNNKKNNKKLNSNKIQKIMKNFDNNGNGRNSTNSKNQSMCDKNIKARRIEYKKINKKNNINYNICNNINNNINNININTSNNLINLITNITTTNEEFQSLVGKKTYIKHYLTNSLIQNKKCKKENDSQIKDNVIRLSEANSTLNKCNNNNYIKNKFLKNHFQKNDLKNIQKLDKKILNSLRSQNIINNNKKTNKNKSNAISESFTQNSSNKKKIKKIISDRKSSNKRFKKSLVVTDRNSFKTKINHIKNKPSNDNNKIKKE